MRRAHEPSWPLFGWGLLAGVIGSKKDLNGFQKKCFTGLFLTICSSKVAHILFLSALLGQRDQNANG